ncbi:MAG: ABC transporter substrate-binding protein [Lachnospiraceae bacterium]|nr:ABC transporter substrate-binding protein [Lachnospiraceae bacterium]
MKRRAIAMVMALTLAAAIPAWAGQEDNSIVVGIGSEFSNLVPLSNNTAVSNRDGIDIWALYDTLFFFDTETSELEPMLATDYTVSEDGLEYTVHLRDDVVFHNGAPMTAEDVAFTYNLLPENTVIFSQQFSGFDYAEAVDDYTVKIYMEQPFAAFANAMASYHAPILCKSYFEEVGWEKYQEAPVGTGPYKFVERVLGGSLTLEAHEEYWGGAPAIKSLKFSILPDANSQILSLETGEIDVLYNPSIQSLMMMGENEEVQWDSTDSFMTCMMMIGGMSHLGTDENLRKAFYSALDIDSINEIVNYGYTKRADCLLAPGVIGRPDEGSYTSTLPYDVEAAKEFLAASEYDGSALKLICLAGSKEESICKIMQSNLQAVGINAEVAAVDGATHQATMQAGEYDISIYSTLPSLSDANLLFQQFDRNTANFQNSKFPEEDKAKLADLADATLTEMDPEARKELFAEMTSLCNEHVYLAYLYYDVNTIAYRNGLSGIHAISGTNYRVADWSWE